jgi:hypothetical protein
MSHARFEIVPQLICPAFETTAKLNSGAVNGPRADFSGLLEPKVTHLNLSTQTASWVRSFALSARKGQKKVA